MSSSIFEKLLVDMIREPEKRDGDYTKDGILFCGKCNKPRQMNIKIGEVMRTVPIMCRCEEKEYQHAKEVNEKMEHRRVISETLGTLNGMGVHSIPLGSFVANDRRNEKNTSQLIRYVTKFEDMLANNIGLMLYGETGCGKTFFAECVANYLLSIDYYVIVSNIRAIANATSEKYGNQRQFVINQIRGCDLLVLDDFGAERDTSYMAEQTYDIINERYKARKPLLVTTNLNPADMASCADITQRRIYERVLECCTPVLIEGHTRRAEATASKMRILQSLLNAE